MAQIPSQIPLALRGIIGDPLTNEQIDELAHWVVVGTRVSVR